MTNTFIMLLVSVFILMAVYVVYMLIMSLWTIVVGLCLGFQFLQFTFIGMSIKNDAGKLSFLVAPARLTAETLIVKNDENGRDIIRLNVIETVLTIITSILTAFIMYKKYGMNNYIKSMFVCLFLVIVLNVYVVYTMLKEAFGTGVHHDLWEHTMIVKNRLVAGMRPADCEPMQMDDSITTPTADRCRLYNYYYYLDTKQYDELQAYITRFINIIGDINNVAPSSVPYAYEIVYYYSVIQPNLTMAEHYYALVSAWLEKDMDLNGRRVYAAYLYGTNKPLSSVKSTISQGIQRAGEDLGRPSVMRSFELQLLNELREKADNQNGGSAL
ncbi:MAG: hypothetical protein II919_09160 [Lachnospiraceae bacterium]|nr:hypothetical protein [Lachnospiraceae bacterium]